MAKLKNSDSKTEVSLLAHHIFGRATDRCDTVINDPGISLIHASMRWDGERWVLNDQSRNGTWLNNKRIHAGVDYDINTSDSIAFRPNAAENWTLIDDSRPQTMLIAMSPGLEDIALDTTHLLPNEDSPYCSIFCIEENKYTPLKWVMSKNGVDSILSDGDFVSLPDGSHWKLQLPTIPCGTVDERFINEGSTDNCLYEFNVSADEEHTSLKLNYGDTKIELGTRNHHYLLLQLARIKLEQKEAGFEKESIGWVDIERLESMMGMSQFHLNIQIHRLRQQVKKALSGTGYENTLFERRIGSIRFIGHNFRIYREKTFVEGLCDF